MARPLRSNLENGWYHVFHHGIGEDSIFLDKRDREHFVNLLAGIHERYRIIVHAYCLMKTHWHGIVQTPDANLSAAMQWLHLSHATWINTKHKRLGPLWRGRFHSVPIEDGTWSYKLSLYVHLNPVCTNLFGLDKHARKAERIGFRKPNRQAVSKRLKRLREYPWSSYPAYAGYAAVPDWLTTEELLKRAHDIPARRKKQYRANIGAILGEGIEATTCWHVADSVAIGSEQFRKGIKDSADGGGRETAGKRELRKRVTFEEIVAAAEDLQDFDWEAACSARGDWRKWLVAWAVRHFAGLTLRETGVLLGGKDYAAVGVGLKRFEIRAQEDNEIQTAQRQLAERLLGSRLNIQHSRNARGARLP